MKLRQGPVILLILLVFALIGVVCNTTGSISRTVREMPDEIAGAEATRAAIEPGIVPTVRYNEHVLPTQQAEEANQITETMTHKYQNARHWNDFATQCKRVVIGALTIFSAIATASLTGAVVGAVVFYLVERYKRARAYEPVQVVQSKPFLVPQWRMLVEPRTGLMIPYTTEHEASIDHGTLLIEARTGKRRARWRITPRQSERHPEMIEALKQ
jgi:hypothetical protein